jgi:hypothetical protein
MMIDAALIARPESHEALTAATLHAQATNNAADAVKFARAAVAAAPQYAGGPYALAAALQLSSRTQADATNMLAESRQMLTLAGELDRSNLQGREVPSVQQLWRYLVGAGRTPVMAPPR